MRNYYLFVKEMKGMYQPLVDMIDGKMVIPHSKNLLNLQENEKYDMYKAVGCKIAIVDERTLLMLQGKLKALIGNFNDMANIMNTMSLEPVRGESVDEIAQSMIIRTGAQYAGDSNLIHDEENNILRLIPMEVARKIAEKWDLENQEEYCEEEDEEDENYDEEYYDDDYDDDYDSVYSDYDSSEAEEDGSDEDDDIINLMMLLSMAQQE